MRQLSIIAILSALLVIVLAAPVEEEKGGGLPVHWPTILLKATEFLKLYDNTFDSMRNVVENENTAIGFMISEHVILAHRKALGVIVQVIRKINQHNLTCKDIRFHTEEVIQIFSDLFNFLINIPEISLEGKGRLKGIYVGTVLNSSKLVNHVSMLLGCPSP